MKVLFITSSRLGDAVLSTGLIDHIVKAYPAARLTIVCGALPAPIFAGVPRLERVIILKKKSWNRHWIGLWREVIGTRWDMVVDLRDSAVSRLIVADRRFIYTKAISRNQHKVEQIGAVMKLFPPPSPRVWVTEEQKERAEALIPDGGAVLGIGPTSNWIGKTWEADKFIELIKILTAPNGILPHARVAIFAAPKEEEAAYKVLNSIPKDRQIDIIAKADPATVIAALARCSLYIGNDSGLMHSAAAAGVPTVGLFGPGYPDQYRPWGKYTTYVQTPETVQELTGYAGYDSKTAPCLMGTLTVSDVVTEVERFWNTYAAKAFL
jgi:lipopolysaccharide export system permease protein